MFWPRKHVKLTVHTYHIKRNHQPVLDPQYLSEEVVNVFEADRISNRIDKEKPISLSHILLSHGTKLLLAGGVEH